jgi:hypothetical protein
MGPKQAKWGILAGMLRFQASGKVRDSLLGDHRLPSQPCEVSRQKLRTKQHHFNTVKCSVLYRDSNNLAQNSGYFRVFSAKNHLPHAQV